MSTSPSPSKPAPATSLYARAGLFVLVGSGTFLGALVMMSVLLVRDARERLLDERMALARAVAHLIESRLQSDVERLASTAQVLLRDRRAWEEPRFAELVLQTAVQSGTLRDGAFILDERRQAILAAPDDPERVWEIDGLDGALTAARRSGKVQLTSLSEKRSNPVLAAVVPVRAGGDNLLGFAVGLLHPVRSDLMSALRQASLDVDADVALLDRRGVHIAATEPNHLLEHTAPKGRLAQAIADRAAFRGIDASHSADGSRGLLPEVLAFAPMRWLPMSVIVVQPEAVALGPALELRNRLLILGMALVILFVAFSLLSVHSVVKPIRGLTASVRRAEGSSEPLAGNGQARDEVGELTATLRQWHQRMLDSLATAEAHRQALDAETRAIRSYLEALQSVSDASTASPSVQPMLEVALERALGLLHADRGVLELERSGHRTVACLGLAPEPCQALLRQKHGDDGAPCGQILELRSNEASAPPIPARSFCLVTAPGLRLTLVVLEADEPGNETAMWLSSLLRHAGMCASHQLLREADRERREQQEQYLHRVLQAQEDERSRVARDLHDTVAQDLAALRLEAERLAAHAQDPEVHRELAGFEDRAREMLATVRRILLDLRLSILEGQGLIPAIRFLLERAKTQAGLHTHLFVDGDESKELRYETTIALFRVMQEALLNVTQHAKAEHLLATIRLLDDRVEMTVEDDGKGFAPDARLPPGDANRVKSGRGLGILGMEERVHLLGGQFRIESQPGEGTTVYVSVPLRHGTDLQRSTPRPAMES